MRSFIAILLLLLGATWAQANYRLCAPDEIGTIICSTLSRGNSQVICETVRDRAECIMKINKGIADFGVFNAEELLLAHQFHPDVIQPIVQLKHQDRVEHEFEFQTVVIVPESFNTNEGLRGLKNGGFCHPGLAKVSKWNDYIHKFFERKSWDHECRADVSVAENEAINLKNFFGRACRPGEWVQDRNEDKRLKEKYPQLCELCDNQGACNYHNTQHNGHFGALDCLVSGRGKAAYVALDYVHQYFGVNLTGPEPQVARPGYQFLCPNGSPMPLTVSKPCAWIAQPWSVVAARKDVSAILQQQLPIWLNEESIWTSALKTIFNLEGQVVPLNTEQSLSSYLATGREVMVSEKTCGNTIRWCTVSSLETEKCRWVAKDALLLGIEPKITCVETNSTFDCLRAISENLADIITIDSNYGYLARTRFNLTTVLYAESDKDKNSAVVAVVKNSESFEFNSLKDLKGKTACFPEYGGIAWVSLVNAIVKQKDIEDTCDYSQALADLFSGACTPGIKDRDHSIVAAKEDIVERLCSICPMEADNSTCSANMNNTYYGDKGVLQCLSQGGHVGFVEPKNVGGHVREELFNQDNYRVLCRNGSLAVTTGFDVDQNCALSFTIDSEVVGRAHDNNIETIDTTMALLKLEVWLGYASYGRRAIRIYDSFTGHHNLLFKDSTVGLEAKDSNIGAVVAYRDLFNSIESCNNAASGQVTSFPTITLFTFIAMMIALRN